MSVAELCRYSAATRSGGLEPADSDAVEGSCTVHRKSRQEYTARGLRRSWRSILGATMASASALGSSARRATSNNKIKGCVNKKTRAVRIITTSKNCKKTELTVVWNKKGSKGSPWDEPVLDGRDRRRPAADRGHRTCGRTHRRGRPDRCHGREGCHGRDRRERRDRCERCERLNGSNGTNGTNGFNGLDGATGAAGATGAVGPTGPADRPAWPAPQGVWTRRRRPALPAERGPWAPRVRLVPRVRSVRTGAVWSHRLHGCHR